MLLMAKSTYGKNILANVTIPSGDLNSEINIFFYLFNNEVYKKTNDLEMKSLKLIVLFLYQIRDIFKQNKQIK